MEVLFIGKFRFARKKAQEYVLRDVLSIGTRASLTKGNKIDGVSMEVHCMTHEVFASAARSVMLTTSHL